MFYKKCVKNRNQINYYDRFEIYFMEGNKKHKLEKIYAIINVNEKIIDLTENMYIENEDQCENTKIICIDYTCNLYHTPKFNPIINCKSAGIIPYTIYNDKIFFLLQKMIYPNKRKDHGWNDFGGKRNKNEISQLTAAREFSEETSCLFYLKEQLDKNILENIDIYYQLIDNKSLKYTDETMNELQNIIKLAQEYYYQKIIQFAIPLYVSSKNTYISYFIKVDYIPEEDIPMAEDIHIDYQIRYLRLCKWFSINEIMNLNKLDIHRRLYITQFQKKILNFYNKGLFL